MEPVNINTILDGEPVHSNYRLRKAPIGLRCVTTLVGGWDEMRWEDDGGSPAPPPFEQVAQERHRSSVRQHPGRKQIAARMNVPRESIKVVPVLNPVPRKVAIATYEGIDPQEVEIRELKAKIERMIGQLQGELIKRRKLESSINNLEKVFEERKVK